MNELDRGVTAMSDHMAHLSRRSTEPSIDPDGAKYVDAESFNVIQGLLGQLQQEHERLMGTAAHLSHELDINKEHVKVMPRTLILKHRECSHFGWFVVTELTAIADLHAVPV